MNLTRYEFTCSDDRLEYYFDSVGPKGTIKKLVEFEQVDKNKSVFNLGFGDLDVVTGIANDKVESNNADRDLIMATIGAIVLDFNLHYPNSLVFAEGSDKARTRLYQMSIASHFAEISLMFHVSGYIDGKWENFSMNKNYECFCVEKKSIFKLN